MTARALVAYLLLLLASISVAELAMDVAAHPGLRHQQSRVRAQHSSTPRVSQRSGPLVTAAAPAAPVLVRLGEVTTIDHPASLPLVPASVFVPPRV
jgi:hypothetical protein